MGRLQGALGPLHRRAHAPTQGPRSFSFPGFTHYGGHSRWGRFVVGRKTDARRVRKKPQFLSERLRGLRSEFHQYGQD